MNKKEQMAFWRQIRQKLLDNLGLPPDTPPEKFQEALEAKERKKRLTDKLERLRRKK